MLRASVILETRAVSGGRGGYYPLSGGDREVGFQYFPFNSLVLVEIEMNNKRRNVELNYSRDFIHQRREGLQGGHWGRGWQNPLCYFKRKSFIYRICF